MKNLYSIIIPDIKNSMFHYIEFQYRKIYKEVYTYPAKDNYSYSYTLTIGTPSDRKFYISEYIKEKCLR